MATLTTKFSIGDVVFCARTTTTKKKHPCPDCNGAKKWKAISPAGGEYEFACPRCAASYQGHDTLNLEYSIFVGTVTRLTIGSIQYNTAANGWDHGARYMCVETGVGSGSVYNEADLFATEAEAEVAADAKAKSQNVTTPWVVKQYDKTVEAKDYQLDSAVLRAAATQRARGQSFLYNIGYLFDDIEKAADKEAILEAVEEYRANGWERDREEAKAEASS